MVENGEIEMEGEDEELVKEKGGYEKLYEMDGGFCRI